MKLLSIQGEDSLILSRERRYFQALPSQITINDSVRTCVFSTKRNETETLVDAARDTTTATLLWRWTERNWKQAGRQRRDGSRSDRGRVRAEGLRSADSCGWSKSQTGGSYGRVDPSRIG